MPQIELAGKTYEVDEDGFLQELDKWSEEFAQAYAHTEDIEGTLTEEHWKLINYLRRLFPAVRHCPHGPQSLQRQRHGHEEAL